MPADLCNSAIRGNLYFLNALTELLVKKSYLNAFNKKVLNYSYACGTSKEKF
jgi:hypothetical protein